MSSIIAFTASLVLAYVLMAAALHKWRRLDEFAAIIVNYRVMPPSLAPPLSYLIPITECALALALLPAVTGRYAAAGAMLLLSVYMAAIAVNLLRGRRDIDCGCGGAAAQRLSGWLLLRNGLLLVLCAAAAWREQLRIFGWYEWGVIVPAAVAGCVFYSAGNQLLANRDSYG